jgi:phenylalanyl-tRNA synthetase beta chain
LRFRAPDRTLTEDDASAARDAAVQRAADTVGAVLRAATRGVGGAQDAIT